MEGVFPKHLPTDGRALQRDRLGEQGVPKASPHVQSRILEAEPEIWKVPAKERYMYKVPQGHSIRNSSGNYHSFSWHTLLTFRLLPFSMPWGNQQL